MSHFSRKTRSALRTAILENLVNNRDAYPHYVLPVDVRSAVNSLLPFIHCINAKVPEDTEVRRDAIVDSMPLGRLIEPCANAREHDPHGLGDEVTERGNK